MCSVHKGCSQCRFCNLIQNRMTVRTGWNVYVAYCVLPNILVQWCDGDSLTNQSVTQYTRFESVTTAKIHPEDCLLCSWVQNRVDPYRFSVAQAACIFKAETAPKQAGLSSSKTSGPNGYASADCTRWGKESGSFGTILFYKTLYS